MKTGIEQIADERARQTAVEGWDARHDDEHDGRSLARAGMCYVQHYVERAWLLQQGPGSFDIGADPDNYKTDSEPDEWPWEPEAWKPKDAIRDLVRAGALIAAEIDRLQRLK